MRINAASTACCEVAKKRGRYHWIIQVGDLKKYFVKLDCNSASLKLATIYFWWTTEFGNQGRAVCLSPTCASEIESSSWGKLNSWMRKWSTFFAKFSYELQDELYSNCYSIIFLFFWIEVPSWHSEMCCHIGSQDYSELT